MAKSAYKAVRIASASRLVSPRLATAASSVGIRNASHRIGALSLFYCIMYSLGIAAAETLSGSFRLSAWLNFSHCFLLAPRGSRGAAGDQNFGPLLCHFVTATRWDSSCGLVDIAVAISPRPRPRIVLDGSTYECYGVQMSIEYTYLHYYLTFLHIYYTRRVNQNLIIANATPRVISDKHFGY